MLNKADEKTLDKLEEVLSDLRDQGVPYWAILPTKNSNVAVLKNGDTVEIVYLKALLDGFFRTLVDKGISESCH